MYCVVLDAVTQTHAYERGWGAAARLCIYIYICVQFSIWGRSIHDIFYVTANNSKRENCIDVHIAPETRASSWRFCCRQPISYAYKILNWLIHSMAARWSSNQEKNQHTHTHESECLMRERVRTQTQSRNHWICVENSHSDRFFLFFLLLCVKLLLLLAARIFYRLCDQVPCSWQSTHTLQLSLNGWHFCSIYIVNCLFPFQWNPVWNQNVGNLLFVSIVVAGTEWTRFCQHYFLQRSTYSLESSMRKYGYI